MSLPKIKFPLFELTVPSSKQKINYRPFTVKEEKILLVAKESEDIEQVIIAIKQILTNCLTDVNINSLSIFDVEYIMIQIRSKSVNNVVEFKINDPDTDEEVDISFNLDDIKIIENKSHSNIIKLTNEISLKMKYPSLDMLTQIKNIDIDIERGFEVMISCVESIIEGDNVYNLKDYADEEIKEFFDNLGLDEMTKIQQFFDTLPKMRYEHQYKLKDGTTKTFVVEGTESFFM